LHRALMKRLDNPTDVIVVADILAWAELKAAAEVARANLLEGDTSSNEVVRLENLTRRAAVSVGLEPAGPPTPPSLQDIFDQIAAEQADDTDNDADESES